jgi:hypothetical protein
LREEAARAELADPAHPEHHRRGTSHQADPFCRRFQPQWTALQKSLRGKVSVGLDAVNPEVRVERAYIVDFNDQMIDVYFEFTRHRGYAWPFRLGNVTVAVTKDATSAQQTVSTPSVTGEVDKSGPVAYSVSQAVGPAPDPNLTYQYTVLNEAQAKILLGRGIAEHFIVLQLSVVNHGASQLSVPLAAIEVEVEWLRGTAAGKGFRKEPRYFIEGPATVAPLPLASVSAYFGNAEKTGRRPSFFNVLSGIATMVAGLVPFAGPDLKDAQVVFTGGLVPALGQIWVDLSAQQLQTLTSLSWETAETVPAGGSMERYIYIQRGEEEAGTVEPTTGRRTMRQISNITGLSLAGFAISAAPAGATPANPPATPAAPAAPADPAASAAPGAAATPAPATPPEAAPGAP